MKKKNMLYGALLAVCLLFTGCGTDPVAKELEHFANDEMKSVNEEYNGFMSDYLKLKNYQDNPEEYAKYIEETLLADLEKIISDVDEIETESAEVTDLKEKYAAFIDGYHSAFKELADAASSEDAESQQKAMEEIQNGAENLEAYNTALKKLADKYDMPVIDAQGK